MVRFVSTGVFASACSRQVYGGCGGVTLHKVADVIRRWSILMVEGQG